MGHRVVKRVPLDFDAPLKKVWEGYLTPRDLLPDGCPTCGPLSGGGYGGRRDGVPHGDGLTPEARAIDQTFYSTQIAWSWDREVLDHCKKLAWSDKLSQLEVDHLLEEGRLRTYVQVPEDQQCLEPCNDAPEDYVWHGDPCRRFKGHDGSHHPRAGEWQKLPRTAAEVNAANQKPGLDGHDGINRSILVRFRCERLGISMSCPDCDGDGSKFRDDEQHAAYEAWMPTEPPTGDGWQLWETTSEGSPVSPVFDSPALLADWCADNATAFASIKWTAAQWLASFEAESTDVDTLLVTRRDGTLVSP